MYSACLVQQLSLFIYHNNSLNTWDEGDCSLHESLLHVQSFNMSASVWFWGIIPLLTRLSNIMVLAEVNDMVSDTVCQPNDTDCFFRRYSNLTLHRINPVKVLLYDSISHKYLVFNILEQSGVFLTRQLPNSILRTLSTVLSNEYQVYLTALNIL